MNASVQAFPGQVPFGDLRNSRGSSPIRETMELTFHCSERKTFTSASCETPINILILIFPAGAKMPRSSVHGKAMFPMQPFDLFIIFFHDSLNSPRAHQTRIASTSAERTYFGQYGQNS